MSIKIIGYNCAASIDDVLNELRESYVNMQWTTTEEFPKMFKISFEIEECENPLTTLD